MEEPVTGRFNEPLDGGAIDFRTGEPRTRMTGPALIEEVHDAVETRRLGLVAAVVRESAYLVAQDENGIGTRTLLRRRNLDNEEPQGAALCLAPVLGDGQIAARVPNQELDLDIPGTLDEREAGQRRLRGPAAGAGGEQRNDHGDQRAPLGTHLSPA
ncbi:MAG TPA: hypothetical protein VEQ37_04080 [Actinomycetota bacterium]|nr:hypothetical protein [Actinomycetota bacterium]